MLARGVVAGVRLPVRIVARVVHVHVPARSATDAEEEKEIRAIANGDSIYISRHVTHTLRLNRPAVTGGAVD
jgi:hypothetical protein